MTLSQLWSLFWSLPLVVRVAVVLALVLLGVGVVDASLAVGRAAGWVADRRRARREARDPRLAWERERDVAIRRVLDMPREQVAAECAAVFEVSADDAEAAL